MREIADTFGVSEPTACRWTKPGAIERDRAITAAWKARNRERNRAADRAYSADLRNRGRCLTCGEPMGIGVASDGECRPCAAARVHERSQRVVEMWAQGDSLNDIASSLGWARGHLASQMDRMRARGYSLPYRYSLTAPRHESLAA